MQLSLRAGNRWTLLNTVDVKAKVLLAMVRLGIRVGAIPEKRYEPIAARLVEIGKIVGGPQENGRKPASLTGNGPDMLRFCALRGGNYNNGVGAGLFGLNLNNNRTNRNRNVGLPSRSRPDTSEARRPRLPGRHRGKRGPFPPRCEAGKQQRSRAASRRRTRRGEFFDKEVGGHAVDGERPGYVRFGVARAAGTMTSTARAFLALNVNCYRSNRNRNVGFRPRSRSDTSEARRPRLPGRHRSKRGPLPPRCEAGKQQRSRAASR